MGAEKVAFLIIGFSFVVSSALDLSIIHLNDFHARFEETSLSSGVCKSDNCIGGFSRVYTAVNQLFEERPDSIFLNAGDNFQGTLWYNLFKWNVTQYFLNMLPHDAMTLGNHEFDDNIQGVVPFLQTIKAPVVVSNIDDSLEPDMQGLYNKSTVITRDGKRIGIVGVILSTTNQLASTGNLRFLDESESVNEEAQRLLDDGVFTVIVLSHCGYEVELEIARKAIPGISVVVGAHSHTLLYSGTPPSGHTAYGAYPTVVQNGNNEPVLVVQAHAYTTYLGNLTVKYDEDGKLIDWEGSPIYLDRSIAQDPEINALLEPYRIEVEETGGVNMGESKVFLEQSTCRYSECNFGNLITDAFVSYYVNLAPADAWTKASIAFINAGGIRSSVAKGDLTYNDLATAQPFENTVDFGQLQGKYIKALMETAAMPYNSNRVYVDINLLQVAGLKVVMDVSQPIGSRVTSLKVRCHACDVPRYEDIESETYYPIAVLSYLVTGGDGFSVISQNLVNYTLGPVDIDVVTQYVAKHSPITAGVEGRITVIADEVRVMYHG